MVDYTAGGHAFDFSTHVCAKCGMTWTNYVDDPRRPACHGHKPMEPINERPIPIEDD
jgi:hypothetical protein